MFADLVGFTTLSERLDPEELRDVLGQYHTLCATALRQFGGYIAQYLGDGLLVYFGYPAAHEDDAQRAVRAGLAIIESLSVLNAQLRTKDIRLTVRIGIHTGLVVISELGGGDWREQLALGETPNVAARLQALARPDAVLLSATTYRLCRKQFQCQPLGAHSLKGLSQPMQVYWVVGEVAAEGAGLGAKATPQVGRERETAALADGWRRAEQGTTQVVFISGEAGIGKSHITRTVAHQLTSTPHEHLELHCSPYHQSSALYPVIELLQRQLKFERVDTPEERLAKVDKVLTEQGFRIPNARALAALLLSLSLPAGEEPLDLSPQQQKDKTLALLTLVLSEAAKHQPIFLVVEDLHWADPSTLELLQIVIERVRAARVLIVLTARPEFTWPWPKLAAMVTTLLLGNLQAKYTQTMIEQVAGGKALPPEVLQQIITKTDGVPLFVEELTRMVLESGLLKEEADHYTLIGPLPPLAIPSTLRDSLMARLDRLATVKEIALLASVIGREFTYELIFAVAGLPESTLIRELDRLVQAGLLYRGGVPPLATYIFKHALIQETAYRSLLNSKRQQYHLQIVQVLEARFAEAAATQPEVLAHHYSEAGLNEQALSYWQKAGLRASQRSAHAEAIQHLTRGLELVAILPPSPQRNLVELDMQTALGREIIAAKGLGAAEAILVYGRARELCREMGEAPPQLFPVLRGINLYYVMRADLHAAYEVAEQLLKLGLRLNDPAVLVPAYHAVSVPMFYLGEFERARTNLELGYHLYDRDAHKGLAELYGFDPGVTTLCWLSWTLWYLGFPEQALQAGEAARTLAESLDHALSYAYALQYLSRVHQFRRDRKAAKETAEACVKLSTEHGFPDWLAQSNVVLGWALSEEGDHAQGLALLKEGLQAYQANGAEAGRPYFLGLLAEACQKAGQIEEGLQAVDEALMIIERQGLRHYEAELHRRQGLLLLARPKPDLAAAEARFKRAIEIATEQNARMLALRAMVSLDQMRGEVSDALKELYAWFSEGLETPDLIEARATIQKER
jgi:class 3 adenylate cyclase/predicted ATPase